MRIPQISSVKSKITNFSEGLADNLDSYAKYLSEQSGVEYEISDVVAHILHDEKRLAEIPEKGSSKTVRVSLKLPSKAWADLEDATKRTGLHTGELIAELTGGLLKDKSFLGWKAKQPAQPKAETAPKKSKSPKGNKAEDAARSGASSGTADAQA
jgi:hypothetical protein